MEMRLQRFLSQAGVASRRKAEELITAGRVQVNGRVVTELGTKIDSARDRVVVAGRTLSAEEHVYILLHKPKGYVTSRHDPDGRPTVMDLLGGIDERIYPVGRLDYNTEGLLVLTNDGELANGLMHPRGEVQKTYRVKLQGLVPSEQLAALERGVTLDDGARTAPAKVVALTATDKNSWIELTIHEGKNRQVHRMADAIGFGVLKLQRVRYAGLELGDLQLGKWRRLLAREVDGLRRAAGLPKKIEHRPSPAAERRRERNEKVSRDARGGSHDTRGGSRDARGGSRGGGRPQNRSPRR